MFPKILASFVTVIFLVFVILEQPADAANDKLEVIEVRNPLKDLPADLEEEPSIERDDVRFQGVTISTTAQPHAIQELKSKHEPVVARRMGGRYSKPDDDETRIEKELSDLYKDSAEYKSDIEASTTTKKNHTTTTTVHTTKTTTALEHSTVDAKPIERAARKDFNFQPDINNKEEVERFRTSVDDIVCDKKFTTERLIGHVTPSVKSLSTAMYINQVVFLASFTMATLTTY